MFKITHNKGFHLTFANGLTISVQFGAGNYCEHHESNDYFNTKKLPSKDAEIAIWHESNGQLLQIDKYDTVIGYLSTDEVAIWIERVVKAKDLAEFVKLYCHDKPNCDEA